MIVLLFFYLVNACLITPFGTILTGETNRPNLKSESMKGKIQSPHYFSAYPLKAIIPSTGSKSNQQQTPYLRSVLSGKTRAAGSRVRVLPMVNPYPLNQSLPQRMNPARHVDGSGDEWFNHYE